LPVVVQAQFWSSEGLGNFRGLSASADGRVIAFYSTLPLQGGAGLGALMWVAPGSSPGIVGYPVSKGAAIWGSGARTSMSIDSRTATCTMCAYGEVSKTCTTTVFSSGSRSVFDGTGFVNSSCRYLVLQGDHYGAIPA